MWPKFAETRKSELINIRRNLYRGNGEVARGRKLPLFLDDDAPERLLAAATKERDRLLLMVGLCVGLRVSELCGLAVEDLDFRRRTLFVRQGKGDKDRCLPIPDILLGPLRGWIGGRQTGPVFPSPRGGELTSRAVQKMLKRLAVKAGLRGAKTARVVTPHRLRHTFATRLLESGATIYEVKELLGHQSIATTEKYLHSTPLRLEQVINRVYEKGA